MSESLLIKSQNGDDSTDEEMQIIQLQVEIQNLERSKNNRIQALKIMRNELREESPAKPKIQYKDPQQVKTLIKMFNAQGRQLENHAQPKIPKKQDAWPDMISKRVQNECFIAKTDS